MKKLIVFNHKMSLCYDEVYSYIDITNSLETDNDIIICPSNIYLEAFENNSDWAIGAQNMHYSTEVNHTGEISSNQLKSLGINYVLVGHEERVREFNESIVTVNQKLVAALNSNIVPILCFGEDMDEKYDEVIPKLLDGYLKDIQNIEFIIFAYEPVYAVNAGMLPKIERIEEVISFVKDYLESKYQGTPNVIYGGSVDSTNAKDIMDIGNIDGILVGAVSSDVQEASRIINSL